MGRGAFLHRQVDRYVRALRQNRNAPVHGNRAMLVRPQKRAVQRVDETIAVRPEDRHRARRRDQPVLQIAARVILGHRLGKAGCETHRAARAHAGQRPDRIDGCMAVDPDKHRIRGLGQIVEAGQRRPSRNFAVLRMHRPDRPGIAHAFRLQDDLPAPGAAAHDGDGLGPQQPGKVLGHRRAYAPRGRNRSRLMMWRWISLVPSQIRSTRASRQNRSMGKSSISPIPPKICMRRVGDPRQHLRRIKLGRGNLAVRRQTLIQPPCGRQRQPVGRVDLGDHVGNLKPDPLEPADRSGRTASARRHGSAHSRNSAAPGPPKTRQP